MRPGEGWGINVGGVQHKRVRGLKWGWKTILKCSDSYKHMTAIASLGLIGTG